MANTFMRFGELRQIRWGDVSFIQNESGKIHNRNLVKILVRKGIAKNRKERTVIGRGGEYIRHIKSYSKYTEKTDFVFCDNDTGSLISKKVFYAVWKQAMAASGLDHSERKLSYYSLRHFGITMRRYAGVSFEDLSLLAGTSFAFIENHYSHIDMGRLLEAATKSFSVDKNGFYFRNEPDRS
jgi:integrase